MRVLRVLKDRYEFREAVERAVNFRPPLIRNDRHLYHEYARASGCISQIGGGLASICQSYLDFEFTPPVIEAFDAAAAALPYAETLEAMQCRLMQGIEELAQALDVPQVGQMTWTDDESCRFTYFEVSKDRGILRNTVRRTVHQHDLVKAKQHRLPADDVPMPKRARQIIRDIPEPLKRYSRVITGLEVRKEVHQASHRHEATWLGNALNVGGRQARSAATNAGAGLAAAGGALTAGLSGVLALLAAPLAVADPAIVVGQVVLYGWEQP